jgi:hypothetical protein
MRKCRSCGYLILGEATECARCGAPLVAVTAPGATVPAAAPAAPPAVSAAPAPPAWAPPAPPGPPAAPGGEPFAVREAWQPVTISTPAPARPVQATRLGVAVLAIVVALGAFLGFTHFRSDPLPAGTSDFASGGGVTFTSPDGAFQVLLPQTPQVEQRSQVVDNVTATLFIAATSTNDYVLGAMSIEFPSSVHAEHVNDLLNAALTGGVSGVNGKLVRKSLLTHDTLPAIEGSFKAPDGYRADVLVIASGSRLIMLFVHSKTGTDHLYKALEDSLIVR